MAGVYGLASYVFPAEAAAILALAARLLVTGALHEDGLADFFDGFGGGTDRSRILAIMKDSHIGSYGVIGLICYFLLLTCLIAALPPHLAVCALLSFDAWNKFVAANLVNPYACQEIVQTLPSLLERLGVQDINELIGGAHGWEKM